jgi:hypothetical protein
VGCGRGNCCWRGWYFSSCVLLPQGHIRLSCMSCGIPCRACNRCHAVQCTHCAVLCAAVQCCAGCAAVLRVVVPCGTVLRCAVLCCAVLRCAVLCCAVLCCAVLCCAVLCCQPCPFCFCFASCCACCTTLCRCCAASSALRRGAVPCCFAWYRMTQACAVPSRAQYLLVTC